MSSFSRRLAGATCVALLGSMLLAGGAGAADSRVFWIGAPDLSVVDANGVPVNSGKLYPTPVSVPRIGTDPNSTMFAVEVLSTDNQNIAHVVLTINANYQDATGLSLSTFYDPDVYDPNHLVASDDDYCSPTGNVITCDFGSLPAGGSRTIAVVADVASNFDAARPPQGQPTFWAQVTTNNENGANTQIYTATSGVDDPATLDVVEGFLVSATAPDSLNSFVAPGQAKQYATYGVGAGGGGNLSTNVNFVANGLETVAISEGTNPTLFYACPAGLTCQPDYSQVVVGDGAFAASPYFHWKLTALVPKTYTLAQSFVAHYPTEGAISDWTLYFKSKSSFCDATNVDAKIASQGHCIFGLSLTKYDKTNNLLFVDVVMDSQGGMRY